MKNRRLKFELEIEVVNVILEALDRCAQGVQQGKRFIPVFDIFTTQAQNQPVEEPKEAPELEVHG